MDCRESEHVEADQQMHAIHQLLQQLRACSTASAAAAAWCTHPTVSHLASRQQRSMEGRLDYKPREHRYGLERLGRTCSCTETEKKLHHCQLPLSLLYA